MFSVGQKIEIFYRLLEKAPYDELDDTVKRILDLVVLIERSFTKGCTCTENESLEEDIEKDWKEHDGVEELDEIREMPAEQASLERKKKRLQDRKQAVELLVAELQTDKLLKDSYVHNFSKHIREAISTSSGVTVGDSIGLIDHIAETLINKWIQDVEETRRKYKE